VHSDWIFVLGRRMMKIRISDTMKVRISNILLFALFSVPEKIYELFGNEIFALLAGFVACAILL
jgi:hypothetical protein